jgi:hypothetical protein
MEKNTLKNAARGAGLALFILIGAVAVYNLAIKPRIVNLDQYVELLGDRLLTMVPEGSGKEKLAGMYQGFLERVRKREVDPAQVERVAAGILNLSNAHETLTPEQAEAVIRLASAMPEIDSVRKAPMPFPSPTSREWDNLGKRLEVALEFNEKMKELPKSPEKGEKPLTTQIMFRVDNGLKIIVNSDIRTELNQQKSRQFSKELQKLEQQKILLWQKDYDKEMAAEMRKAEAELKKVQKELAEQNIQVEVQVQNALEIVNSLKELDSLRILIPVNLDSVMREVQIEVNAAQKKVEKK